MDRRLEIDNRSLVEECKKGDREALNLFYLRFASPMLGVIRRYVPERKDAEDILHDGFIVALTRLKTLRDPEKVDYWLASIMKNLSLQFLQAQDVAQLLHEQKEMEDTPVMDSIIDMEVLESLIRKLPPGYQKVFRLAVLENKSHKEIGEILGIGPKSSSSQLFHAKLMMRKLITDYRRQAGIWSLLLLGVAAGTILWLGRVERLPQNETSVLTAADGLIATDGLTVSNGERVGKEMNISQVAEKDPATDNNLYTATDPEKIRENKSGVEEERDVINSTRLNPMAIREKAEEHVAEETGQGSIGEEATRHEEERLREGEILREGASLNRAFSSGWSLIARAEPGFVSGKLKGVAYNVAGNGFFGNTTEVGSGYNKKNMAHRNDFPISFTLAASRRLTERIGIESGLSYTYLRTTFEKGSARSHARWHYLGIPLRVNFQSFSTGRLKLYGAVGGSLEIPLHSSVHPTGSDGSAHFLEGSFRSPCVWTLSGSYGASVKLSERFELFVEPTVQVYLHNEATVPNMWSDNRVGFSLPLGLRINW